MQGERVEEKRRLCAPVGAGTANGWGMEGGLKPRALLCSLPHSMSGFVLADCKCLVYKTWVGDESAVTSTSFSCRGVESQYPDGAAHYRL